MYVIVVLEMHGWPTDYKLPNPAHIIKYVMIIVNGIYNIKYTCII